MRTTLLVAHIACGGLGLVVGPLAMGAPKRPGRHPALGRLYQGLVAGLCATAIGLVPFRPEVWPLAVIAVLTEAAALGGWWMRVHQPHDWVRHHIALMCGSYVSFVTAFLVVQDQDALWPWVVPTLVATPLITRASLRHRSPRAVVEVDARATGQQRLAGGATSNATLARPDRSSSECAGRPAVRGAPGTRAREPRETAR